MVFKPTPLELTEFVNEFLRCGGDEGGLGDYPFKALEPLVSVYQELILYQKTCTRIATHPITDSTRKFGPKISEANS